jgi:heme exporter protein D
MIDLGPHAAFIWASYAIYGVVLTALVGWLIWDGARLQSRLADLEARGVSRRSRAASAKETPSS